MKQHTISEHNLETMQTWLGNVDETLFEMESDPNADLEPHKYSYHMGAYHAFNNVLELIPPTKKELKEKTPISGRGLTLTLVTVGTVGAITYRKEIKAGVKKLKAKFRG